jgi:hypothetical protein
MSSHFLNRRHCRRGLEGQAQSRHSFPKSAINRLQNIKLRRTAGSPFGLTHADRVSTDRARHGRRIARRQTLEVSPTPLSSLLGTPRYRFRQVLVRSSSRDIAAGFWPASRTNRPSFVRIYATPGSTHSARPGWRRANVRNRASARESRRLMVASDTPSTSANWAKSIPSM